MYTYSIELVRVIDGDTIKADIDLGFNMWLRNISVRFAGLNAPETRTRDLEEKARGLKVKEFVKEKLELSDHIMIQVDDIGKFGRPIAAIHFKEGAGYRVLNDILIANGMCEAKEY